MKKSNADNGEIEVINPPKFKESAVKGPKYEKPKKKGGVFSRPKVFLYGLIVGIVLCLGVAYNLFAQGLVMRTSEGLSPSVVFSRIVAEDEMVSVSQQYSIVDKAEDANSFFDIFDIPFTENSFWYRYVGTIKAGMNLKTADINVQGSKVTITLDQPYIISNEPDMDKSGCLEENNNMLNPIHVEDVVAFQKQCKEQSEKDALEDGDLLNQAKANAESNLTDMFTAALGDGYEFEYKYRG